MPNSFYHAMAAVMAACYAVTHNYALAIGLLTLMVVAVTTPLTWKSTRGMLAMQVLAPEIKKLQAKHKGDKEALNQATMELYREHKINPMAGCLPLVPQMVVFLVLYRTISFLSHKTKKGIFDPLNIAHNTQLYHALEKAGGHMKVWGFDLSLGVRTAHGSAVIGCWILVALVVGAQYFQTRQMNSRNPAAAANPQAQMMQKIFPLFFGLISISIQAGVNIYFLVSALCRIAQQTLMFRHDPVLRAHVERARAAGPIDVASRPGGPGAGGFMARLLGTGGPTPPARPAGGRPARGGAAPPPRPGGRFSPGGVGSSRPSAPSGASGGGSPDAGSSGGGTPATNTPATNTPATNAPAGSAAAGNGGAARSPGANPRKESAFSRFFGLTNEASPPRNRGGGRPKPPSSASGLAPGPDTDGPNQSNGSNGSNGRANPPARTGGGRGARHAPRPANRNRSRSKKPRR